MYTARLISATYFRGALFWPTRYIFLIFAACVAQISGLPIDEIIILHSRHYSYLNRDGSTAETLCWTFGEWKFVYKNFCDVASSQTARFQGIKSCIGCCELDSVIVISQLLLLLLSVLTVTFFVRSANACTTPAIRSNCIGNASILYHMLTDPLASRRGIAYLCNCTHMIAPKVAHFIRSDPDWCRLYDDIAACGGSYSGDTEPISRALSHCL